MKSLEELNRLSWEASQVHPRNICTTAGTQFRTGINDEVVAEYQFAIDAGAEFPPIRAVFDGARYLVIDGFHRYRAMCNLGKSTIPVHFVEGDLSDAQYLAMVANQHHGLRRTNADKELSVKAALVHPLTRELNDSSIASICGVSRSFVGGVRDPEVKSRQLEAKERHSIKRANEIKASLGDEDSLDVNQSGTENLDDPLEIPIGGEVPDEVELLANEAQRAADLETLAAFLDADDKMKHLYQEVQRLTALNVGFDLRIKELMNEKRAAVQVAKKYEREIKRLKNPSHRDRMTEVRLNANAQGRTQVLETVRNALGCSPTTKSD